MRDSIFKKILAVSVMGILLLTGCSDQDASVSDTDNPEETVQSQEAEDTQEPTETPVAMENLGESMTPSGVSVTEKYQNYKVVMGVNVRADCSGDSELRGSLYGGEVLQGTGVCENGWIQILYYGEICYLTGSCVEETEDAVTEGLGDRSDPSDSSEDSSSEEYDDGIIIMPNPVDVLPSVSPQVKVDVADWAKYTSSKWTSDGATSCFVQIHSVAGNTVVFRFYVVDGPLSKKDQALTAEVKNCTGKIEDGVMNFTFTDNYENIGAGRMEIVDDTHLNIITVITSPGDSAEYKAEILTELTKADKE